MKKTFIYKQTEEFTLEADYYEEDRKQSPLIIFIHGGGLIWGQKEELSVDVAKFYNDNGYKVLSINYRLAPETCLKDIISDIEDSIEWAITNAKQINIDPEKIAVIGHSAGAYLALCTGMFSIKPKAIISFYGYGDLTSNWCNQPNKDYLQNDLVTKETAESFIRMNSITYAKTEERFLLYLYARQTGTWGKYLSNNQSKLLADYSPIFKVEEDFPPTLFLHGTNDKDVPYEQSVFMRAALLKKCVPTRLITIPNGEHVFDKPFLSPIVQNAYKEVIEFLNTHV